MRYGNEKLLLFCLNNSSLRYAVRDGFRIDIIRNDGDGYDRHTIGSFNDHLGFSLYRGMLLWLLLWLRNRVVVASFVEASSQLSYNPRATPSIQALIPAGLFFCRKGKPKPVDDSSILSVNTNQLRTRMLSFEDKLLVSCDRTPVNFGSDTRFQNKLNTNY